MICFLAMRFDKKVVVQNALRRPESSDGSHYERAGKRVPNAKRAAKDIFSAFGLE
jgi:hypothetical protein